MAITYVGGTTGTGTAATYAVSLTSLTGGIGSAPQADDLVIVITGWAAITNGDPGVDATASPGYTEVQDAYANDTRDANLSTSYKFMGGTPDTSVTVNGSGAANYGGATVVQVWRGVDLTTPMDVTPVLATGANAAFPNAGSITPVTAGAVIVAGGLATGDTTPTAFTGPSGMSNFISAAGTGSSQSATAGAASLAWTSGAYDAAAWTVGESTASDSWGAVALALRPGPTALIADVGTITVTGQTVALLATTVVAADVGSFGVTGQTVALPAPIKIAAGVGTIAVTGQDVAFPGGAFAASGAQNLGLLVRGQFDSGDFTMFTGLGSIVLDGVTYIGGGTALQIGESADSTGTEASALSITLSGIDPEIIALAEAEEFQRRRVDILLALLDDQGQILDTDLFFSGLADNMDSDDNPAAPRVTLTCEARVLDLRRPRPFKYLPEDQKRRFPGDTFFDLVQVIQNREDTWGQ